jgi:hypothetical protein
MKNEICQWLQKEVGTDRNTWTLKAWITAVQESLTEMQGARSDPNKQLNMDQFFDELEDRTTDHLPPKS